ncbi:MAG: hypothetical protein U0R44_04570 [Candidatus Micrarchaeia archaeon]
MEGEAKRVAGIDRFRGFSIVLMVFFTMTGVLSDRLPDPLRHNLAGSVHAGDFVLPLFLFASGMSLVHYVRKRGLKKDFPLDVAERTGFYIMIWIFISPLSAGAILQMDELVLSIILSLLLIVLLTQTEMVLAGAGILVISSYLVLGQSGMLPDFSAYYLGGFPAAIFYLPVMIGGALAAMNEKRIGSIAAASLALTGLLMIAVPPYKLLASPSFMTLSVAVSCMIYLAIRNIPIPAIEYLGRKPIRYWVFMFVAVLAPLVFYARATEEVLPMDWEWPAAVAGSCAVLIILYAISVVFDSAAGWLSGRFRKQVA